jgi:hypothetical protein
MCEKIPDNSRESNFLPSSGVRGFRRGNSRIRLRESVSARARSRTETAKGLVEMKLGEPMHLFAI